MAAGTDPVRCGRDNTGQSALSCSERQGWLGPPLEILACRVGPHTLPTERSPRGAQMAAEWPAARGASVQREGRSPCSRRLGAAPRSPSSVTGGGGGEKAPRAPPALLLAAGTGRGPRHSRRDCRARPIARLLVLLLTCAPHGAGAGETPRTLQIETRKLRSTGPGLPPLPAEPQLPRGQAGLRKKAKVMAKGFFFFPSVFISKNMNCRLGSQPGESAAPAGSRAAVPPAPVITDLAPSRF